MGDEEAQRDINAAESISGDDIREPRRQNSPCANRACMFPVVVCSRCARASSTRERHQAQGHKERKGGSKIPVLSWEYCFFGARNRNNEAEVEQGGDGPVLVMHDGVTRSIFARLIPSKGVDFPSCERAVKMIVQDLDDLGYHRVVYRCDNEPSILALLRAVKLAWAGDVVQETSAEGDPQSNGAAESSVLIVNGDVRSIQLAVESASGVEVPADHDLLTWPVPFATNMVCRDGKTVYESNAGRRAVPPLAQFGERLWWMLLEPSNRRLGPLNSRFEQGRFLGPVDGSNAVFVGTARRTMEWQLVGRSIRQRIGTKCTGRRRRQSWDQSACFATTRDSPLCLHWCLNFDKCDERHCAGPISSSLATQTSAHGVPTQEAGRQEAVDHSEQCRSRMEAILVMTTEGHM